MHRVWVVDDDVAGLNRAESQQFVVSAGHAGVDIREKWDAVCVAEHPTGRDEVGRRVPSKRYGSAHMLDRAHQYQRAA